LIAVLAIRPQCYHRVPPPPCPRTPRRTTNGFVVLNLRHDPKRLVTATLAVAMVATLGGCGAMSAALRLRDGKCRSLAERALAARSEGDDDEALRLLTEATERDPEAIELHRELAAIYAERAEGDAAVRHLARVVELDPLQPDAWIRLAETLAGEQEMQRAVLAANRALELDPNCTQALLVKARVFEETGRPDDALDVHHHLLELDPGNVDSRLAVARIHLRNGHATRAAPVLRSLCECPLANDDARAEAWWSLGIAYGRVGRWTDAVRALETGATERTATPDDLYRLAYAHHEAGDVLAAKETLDELRAHAPDHPAGLQLAHALAQAPRVLPAVATNVPAPAGW
jgi:tetratricopeptide (TPR) repeat protein